MSFGLNHWHRAWQEIRPRADHVDVWRIRTTLDADHVARFGSLLSRAQRDRAMRLRITEKRDQYIITQGLTRIVLGRMLDTAPEALAFTRGPKGKPYLDGEFSDTGTQFNMTHTSHMALVAVAMHREVGIDIERIRDNLQWEKLARRYFSEQEYRGFRELPGESKLRAFFTCWTRKEAVLKAIGTGLGGGLASFDVSVDPDAPPVLLGNRWQGRFHGDWSMAQIEPGNGYVATLVGEGNGFTVRCWDVNPDSALQ